MKVKPSRIVEARKIRGMSQRDLAVALGITVQAISQWENGKTEAFGRLGTLALALNCDPEFLLDESFKVDYPLTSDKHPQSPNNRVAVVSLDNAVSWIFDQRTSAAVEATVIKNIYATNDISKNSFAIIVEKRSEHFKEGDILIFDQIPSAVGDYVFGASMKQAISKMEARSDGSVNMKGFRGVIMRLTEPGSEELAGEEIRVREQVEGSGRNTSVIIVATLVEHRTFPSHLGSP